MCKKSRIVSEDPKRAQEKALSALPCRLKLRRLSDEPRCRKSITLQVYPNRAKWRTENLNEGF